MHENTVASVSLLVSKHEEIGLPLTGGAKMLILAAMGTQNRLVQNGYGPYFGRSSM